MLKILYIHGLESKQGGAKVDYLSANHCIHAPAMKYFEPNLTERTVSLFQNFKPDVIIGSSMGGYIANELSHKFNTPAILLNPALIDPPQRVSINDELNKISDNLIVIVLGKLDSVLPYESILDYLQKNNCSKLDIREYGHRTPLDEFVNICEQYLN